MKRSNVKLTINLAIVCIVLFGGWVVTHSDAAADSAALKQAPDDELQRLLAARLDSATKALRSERKKMDVGTSTFEMVYVAAQRLRDAELALSGTLDARVNVLTKHVALMRQLEEDVAARVKYGKLAIDEVETPRYCRLTAELELLRLKSTAVNAK